MSTIWANEQLFRLQCDMGKYDTKVLLKEIKVEQARREENMKGIKIRLIEIERCQERYKIVVKEMNMSGIKAEIEVKIKEKNIEIYNNKNKLKGRRKTE